MPEKKILLVDDEKLIRWSVGEKLRGWGMLVTVAEDGQGARQGFQRESPDLVILDINLPDERGTELLRHFKNVSPQLPVVMITAYGSIDEAVEAMRLGAYDFITKPIDFLKLKNTLTNAFEAASLREKVAFYKERAEQKFDGKQIVAVSAGMREALDMTKIVAESEATTVLLQGESGTGKDLLAQALHYLSRRRDGPYLVINCSALPENLLESELFGYEKGAFTDAKQQKKGLAELAHRGTLFLDEIGTLGLPLQAKLLRFLETRSFKRVGGLGDIQVDLRVVAATNQDLEAAVHAKTFRQDLYYRLNVCPIFIPPLRERLDDILPLVRHFVTDYNRNFGKQIKGPNKKAEKIFLDYAWPGNVRELKNAVERAMIFQKGSFITPEYLPLRPSERIPASPEHGSFTRENEALNLERMERALLIKALRKTSGNKSQAASILGVTRDTLRYRMRKWGLKPQDYSG